MSWIEPLNLEYWLVNVFSGSPDIFTFISFIFIASMAAYFKMMNLITLMMFVLFAVLMSQYLGGVYLIVALLVGLVGAYQIGRIVK